MFQYKIDTITNNLEQLTPVKHKRSKRWDALGSAWKWVAGSPDAEDLRAIESSINDLTDNNNQQITTNLQLQYATNNLSKLIEQKMSIDAENIENFAEELSAIQILFSLDIINDEIESIRDAITFSKVKILNKKLITRQETKEIAQRLEAQGVTRNLMDEALQFITTSVATNGELILYALEIPNFSRANYDHLHIEPVSTHAEHIRLPGKLYLRNGSTLYVITGECPKIANLTICETSKLQNISGNQCIDNIINGRHGECSYEIAEAIMPIVEMGEGILLLNEVNDTMRSTCGVADRWLNGSYLVTYQNCSVSLGNSSFTNRILETTAQPFFIASSDLSVKRLATYENLTMGKLHQLHLRMQGKLEHLDRKSKATLWSLSMTTITILALAFVIIRYGFCRKKGAQVQIDERSIHFHRPPTLADTYSKL